MVNSMVTMKKTVRYSRRALSRVEASQDIWVCWRCNGFEDIARVRDLSVEGLFIQTVNPNACVGVTTRLDFLVQEGAIRAEAIVRHVVAGSGMGLQFTAVEDRSLLRTVISRLRSA
jgi:hypothetical protein